MREEIVSFQTAKLAKEKGFNEPCWEAYGVYSQFGDLKGNECLQTSFENEVGWTFDEQDYDRDNFYLAPTQSLLQKWLREVHGIHIDIRMIEDDEDYEKMTWAFQVITKNLFGDVEYGDFNSYEETLEVGLQEALKLIK